MNSFSISHSTQASMAPLLVSGSGPPSVPPSEGPRSHLALAASSVQEAYDRTSCGVLATPPTMICTLGGGENKALNFGWGNGVKLIYASVHT